MNNFFTILGGMGTQATESFIHVLNKRTPTHSDQDYLNYVLVNHATVPDRTAYILGNSSENPSNVLQQDIRQHSLLKPNFFVLTCNTAHYFYSELSRVTDIPILHMPRLAVAGIQRECQHMNGSLKVGLLATEGTMQTHVYHREMLKYENIDIIEPGKEIQSQVTHLIYHEIKERGYLNESLYLDILNRMFNEKECDVVLLGCTELSLMAENTRASSFLVIDAQSELVNETIRLARSPI